MWPEVVGLVWKSKAYYFASKVDNEAWSPVIDLLPISHLSRHALEHMPHYVRVIFINGELESVLYDINSSFDEKVEVDIHGIFNIHGRCLTVFSLSLESQIFN